MDCRLIIRKPVKDISGKDRGRIEKTMKKTGMIIDKCMGTVLYCIPGKIIK